ncbi:MAG TPA: sulfotransferase [Acidimicrobiales bacterium]|nr:sulfotransferase [Acidimicrobiales bacterium]
MTERPLFLVGAPRSGTSLLYKALCLHPEVAYISNWVNRFPSVPQLAWANRLAARLPAAQRRVWFGGGDAAYVYGRRRPAWERAFPMPVEGEPFFRRAGVPETAEGSAPGDHDTLVAAFARLRQSAGGRVVVNKRIGNNRRIPLLAGAFPEARFVELVRDGRAVAASLRRVDWWPASRVWWRGDITAADAEAAGADPWELCAEAWVEEAAATRAGLASVAPERVLSTTYEQFVGAPDQVLDDVARFAGLDASDGWRRRRAFVRFPDRNQAWRSELPAAAVATIERVQGAALTTHGYA